MPRLLRVPGTLKCIDLDHPAAAESVGRLRELWRENPLTRFEPHPCPRCGRRVWLGQRPCGEHDEAQHAFLMAMTPVTAAFCGNRFGKSTALGVAALRESLPREFVPPWLEPAKRFDAPTAGWILVPTEAKVDDSFRPVFERWCPPSAFQGGSWGKAFNGESMTLRFVCGSTIAFKTYKQDPSTLGGAGLHWVGYDEPPPKKHREECMWRLGDHGGFELFAMTPLEANTGYVRREIWKKRESPDITVVRGSVHDNPTLDRETVKRAIGNTSDIWARAREFGDFVDVGGMIYPDFERCVAKQPFDLDFVRSLDIVVGIDPGIRNAGFAWVGFDHDLTAYVFNEGLLQDREAHEYAAFIHAENKRLGLRADEVAYVCDPQMRARGQVTAQTVMSALAQHGIYANPGQNSHEAGFDQLRTRMRHGRFHVDPQLRRTRDMADDYAAKEPDEFGDDSHLTPVSNQFHILDALRYAVMERFWDPLMDEEEAERNLGYEPGVAPPSRELFAGAGSYPPMGSMS